MEIIRKKTASDMAVVAAGSALNSKINDVIGNKLDDESGNSIYSLDYTLNKHVHSVQHCYPSLANGITAATATSAAWALGPYVVVIPTGTITAPFDIHHIHVGDFSNTDTYELLLYQGPNGSETQITSVRFTRSSNTNPGAALPCITPLMTSGTQIKAKLAAKTAGPENATFSVFYHTY